MARTPWQDEHEIVNASKKYDNLMSMKEVLRYLVGMKRDDVTYWIDRGNIPSIRIGELLVFERADIEAFDRWRNDA